MDNRIIKAAEGMWYTPVNGNESDPVFGKEIYLGVTDSVENWHEVTDEYKAEAELKAIEINRQILKDLLPG